MATTRSAVAVERLTRQTSLTGDAAATLLGSPRTRIALYVLSASDPPVSLERLASDLAARGAARSRDAARIALVHVTLPKLADYGLLEYDLRSETVRVSGPVVSLEEPLGPFESLDSRPDPTAEADGDSNGDGLESIDSRDDRR